MTDRLLLCRVGDLAPGEVRRVERDGAEPLAVYNIDGTFFATDDTCTHAEGSLSEGDLDGDEVICPVHMATFSVRTGEPLGFPAQRALRTYRVLVEDGVVFAIIPGDADRPGAPPAG